MEQKLADIHKAGGILLRDRKFLVARSKNKAMFVAPGGKLEAGETAEQSLVRELFEEFTITVEEKDFEPFGTFYAQAAGNETKSVRMDVFIVKEWRGEPVPSSEITEIAWIDSTPPVDMQIGSIFEHEVLPRLKERGMIG